MTYIVSITSQGQISIPARFRKELGLNTGKKALVSMEDKKLIIEPVKDFLDLRGSLKTDIKATPGQIRKAFGRYLTQEAVGTTR